MSAQAAAMSDVKSDYSPQFIRLSDDLEWFGMIRVELFRIVWPNSMPKISLLAISIFEKLPKLFAEQFLKLRSLMRHLLSTQPVSGTASSCTSLMAVQTIFSCTFRLIPRTLRIRAWDSKTLESSCLELLAVQWMTLGQWSGINNRPCRPGAVSFRALSLFSKEISSWILF